MTIARLMILKTMFLRLNYIYNIIVTNDIIMFPVTIDSLRDFEEHRHLFHTCYIKHQFGRSIKSLFDDYNYAEASSACKYDNWNQLTSWNHNL